MGFYGWSWVLLKYLFPLKCLFLYIDISYYKFRKLESSNNLNSHSLCLRVCACIAVCAHACVCLSVSVGVQKRDMEREIIKNDKERVLPRAIWRLAGSLLGALAEPSCRTNRFTIQTNTTTRSLSTTMSCCPRT